MTEYLRKEFGDMNEVGSYNNDDKDDDDDHYYTNSKDVEVVESGTSDALTMLAG